MPEILISTAEFEQSSPREIEKKFIPIFPEKLDHYRENARPIEQFYLSHTTEPFSLRLRESLSSSGELAYTATLKDRGSVTPAGLDRLEVETTISSQLYNYYLSDDLPVLRKLRAQVNNHVYVDFFADGSVLCESENPIAWTSFADKGDGPFVEVTGDAQAQNEWKAHLDFRRANEGREALVSGETLGAERIVDDIGMALTRRSLVVVQIGGRSGSGKSTIVQEVQQHLASYGVASEVVSTDDYHRGKTHLDNAIGGTWTQWDHPYVYDTETMHTDLLRLLSGETIPRRTIDFGDVEPTYTGLVEPTPVIIIEGIYARSAEFDDLTGLQYEMTTPLATCIGRRHERAPPIRRPWRQPSLYARTGRAGLQNDARGPP